MVGQRSTAACRSERGANWSRRFQGREGWESEIASTAEEPKSLMGGKRSYLAPGCVVAVVVARQERGGCLSILFVVMAITYVIEKPPSTGLKGCIECLRARLRAAAWAFTRLMMLLSNAVRLMRHL